MQSSHLKELSRHISVMCRPNKITQEWITNVSLQTTEFSTFIQNFCLQTEDWLELGEYPLELQNKNVGFKTNNRNRTPVADTKSHTLLTLSIWLSKQRCIWIMVKANKIAVINRKLLLTNEIKTMGSRLLAVITQQKHSLHQAAAPLWKWVAHGTLLLVETMESEKWEKSLV